MLRGTALKLFDWLVRLRNDRTLIELYSNHAHTDSFSCGWVLDVSADFVSLQELNRRGELDSVIVVRTDSVYRIGMRSRYLQALASKNPGLEEGEFRFVPADMLGALRQAKAADEVVWIANEFDQSTPARLFAIDEDTVHYEALEQPGLSKGEEVIEIRAITRIEMYGPDEQSIRETVVGRYPPSRASDA